MTVDENVILEFIKRLDKSLLLGILKCCLGVVVVVV